MRNAYNNLRGWVRDVRAARQAAFEGDKGAGELLDAVCDELDVLIEFGSDDDGVGAGGHDDGVGDSTGMAESEMVPRDVQVPSVPVAGAGTRRVSTVRRGTVEAQLGPRPGTGGGATTVIPRRGG